MRQQTENMQSLSQKTDYVNRHVQQNGTSALMGNGLAQQKINLVQDVSAWLDFQYRMIASLEQTQQTERVNGVMETVERLSTSFQNGEDIVITQLPKAPRSKEQPTLSGVMTELRSVLTDFNLSLTIKNQSSTLVAGLNAGYIKGDGTVDRALLTASARSTGVDTKLQALATSISALRLKLPDEGSTALFSVAQYGDFASIPIILKECIAMGIRSPDQVAYILSTAWIESRMGDWMTESAWLSQRSAEREGEYKYGPNGRIAGEARRMGNTQAGDGAKYMGRGFVQITWKNNYKRMSDLLVRSGYQYTHQGVTYGDGKNGTQTIDLVKNYRHVNENKQLAARIMVLGMDGGHFAQSGGLDTYIPENRKATHQNFQNARKIVNGSDKKVLIADNAVTLAAVLRNGDAWVKMFTP